MCLDKKVFGRFMGQISLNAFKSDVCNILDILQNVYLSLCLSFEVIIQGKRELHNISNTLGWEGVREFIYTMQTGICQPLWIHHTAGNVLGIVFTYLSVTVLGNIIFHKLTLNFSLHLESIFRCSAELHIQIELIVDTSFYCCP